MENNEKKQKTIVNVMSKRIISMFLIGIIIIVAVSAASSFISSMASSEESVRNMATLAVSAVDNKFADWTSTVQTMAISESLYSTKSLDSRLDFIEKERARLGFDALCITDYNGIVVGGGNDMSSRDYYPSVIAGSTVITSPYYNDFTKTTVVSIATPFYGEKTSIQGMLVATIDSGAIWDVISNISLFETGFLYIINTEGAMVAHPNETFVTNGDSYTTLGQSDPGNYEKAAKFTQSTIIPNPSGHGYFTLEGVSRMVGFDTLSNSWTIVAVVPTIEIAGGTFTGMYVMAFTGVFILIACAYLIRRYAETIANPVKNASDRLKALTQGDINSPTVIFEDDTELGVMSDSLDFVVKWLQVTIGEISSILQSMADGDLTVEVKGDYPGDTEAIKTSFEKICNSLNGTLSTISDSSAFVDSGASQVNLGSQILSEGAIAQAESVELLSQTIDGVTNSIQESANNSKLASDLSTQAIDQVEHSSQQMERMLGAMDDISNASNEIVNIIKVIEDIAFQTNILSLNASVEAARAGEHGKGFAVVADEVRTLAGRSSQASKQTATLITEAIEASKRGSEIANETASTLHEIRNITNEIADSINVIYDAASSQATASNSVKEDIHSIADVVQTNTATAEESAAASDELTLQSNALRAQIDKFKLRSVNVETPKQTAIANVDEEIFE